MKGRMYNGSLEGIGLPRDGIHGKVKKVSGMMSKGSNLLLGFGHA